MLNKKRFYVALFLILFISTSCKGSLEGLENLPNVGVSRNKINTNFIIYEDPVASNLNTHKNDEYLAVSVQNNSADIIVFHPQFVKIYVWENDQWISAENAILYPENDLVLPARSESPFVMEVVVFPSVPNISDGTPFLIFFTGEVQSTGEKVGAYLEVVLSP